MMKFEDVKMAINFNLYDIIIENRWTGMIYPWVTDDTEVTDIIPIDEKTIKLGVTMDADTEARIYNI